MPLFTPLFSASKLNIQATQFEYLHKVHLFMQESEEHLNDLTFNQNAHSGFEQDLNFKETFRTLKKLSEFYLSFETVCKTCLNHKSCPNTLTKVFNTLFAKSFMKTEHKFNCGRVLHLNYKH